jgi:hypothetical protein
MRTFTVCVASGGCASHPSLAHRCHANDPLDGDGARGRPRCADGRCVVAQVRICLYQWSSLALVTCASRWLFRGALHHRGQQASDSRLIRFALDSRRGRLRWHETQRSLRHPPFARLPVREICRPRLRVVSCPLGKVTVREGIPVECFCCLLGAKRRSGSHCTRSCVCGRRPTCIERTVLS